MLTLLRHSDGNAIAFRAHEMLTDADYRDVLIPSLEKMLEQHAKVRVLLDCDEDFRGWEPQALWDDAKFGIQHRDQFERLALVGGSLMAQWGVKVANHFVKGELKTFDEGEFDPAWAWLTAE
ncbi:MAG: SpoIIAA family protein [Planctomycetota bacterium]|jgi:hypothetical protein